MGGKGNALHPIVTKGDSKFFCDWNNGGTDSALDWTVKWSKQGKDSRGTELCLGRRLLGRRALYYHGAWCPRTDARTQTPALRGLTCYRPTPTSPPLHNSETNNLISLLRRASHLAFLRNSSSMKSLLNQDTAIIFRRSATLTTQHILLPTKKSSE